MEWVRKSSEERQRDFKKTASVKVQSRIFVFFNKSARGSTYIIGHLGER